MQKQLTNLFKEKAPALFKEAQAVAEKRPGLFVSPIPFTTFCKTTPPCRHCFWRSMSYYNDFFSHKTTIEEAAVRAAQCVQAGVGRILVPSGCIGHELPGPFCDFIATVKDTATKLNPSIEVYALVNHVGKQSLINLKTAGLDGLSCGLEIPNKTLFKKIRPGDDFAARIQTIKDAASVGLKLWSGFLFGLGETRQDLIAGIRTLSRFELDSVMVMPFQQYPYIEMERRPTANFYDWARLVAILRIHFGDSQIFTKVEYVNWGFIGGANAVIPIMAGGEAGSRQIDELKKMRAAIYKMKPVSNSQKQKWVRERNLNV